jgi:hypothetical protein
VFLALSVPLFWLGAFLAWQKKYRVVERLTKAEDSPRIRIVQWHWFENEKQGPAGFVLLNSGVDAYDFRLNDFIIGKRLFTSEGISTVRGHVGIGGTLPVWVKDAGTRFHNLEHVCYLEFRGSDRPENVVSLTMVYRDHRELWYRTTQSLNHSMATRTVSLGSPHYEYIGPKAQ